MDKNQNIKTFLLEESIQSRLINDLKEAYISNLIKMYYSLCNGDEVNFETLSIKNKYIFTKLITAYERRKDLINNFKKGE